MHSITKGYRQLNSWNCVNKSWSYLLPMLEGSIQEFRGLVAVFLGDKYHPEFDNHIFLLLRHVEDKDFLQFEKKLTLHPMYCTFYDPDKYHVMFVFNVPKEHQKDYDTFKQSKYSQLSEPYKRRIIKFHGYSKQGDGSWLIKTMYLDEELRKEREGYINEGLPDSQWLHIPEDAELGQALDFDFEIYNENMVIRGMGPNLNI